MYKITSESRVNSHTNNLTEIDYSNSNITHRKLLEKLPIMSKVIKLISDREVIQRR